MKNIYRWHFIIVAVLYVVIHTVITIWFEPTTFNIESDNLLYDSKLVAEGVVPFKELFTRSLVPLYVNAAIFSLFGIHIKLTTILVHCVSGLALFFFGKSVLAMFKKPSIALVAVMLMAIFGVRGFSDLFLYLGLYLLLVWRDRQTNWALIASGASIGLSVLSYSAYITWSIALMIFIAMHYLKQISASNFSFGYILKCLLWFTFGCGITLLLPILYFINLTDWQWMADSFMADSFIYAYILSGVLGCVSLCIFHLLKRDITRLALLAPVAGIIMLILFFYRANPGISVKIAVIHDFFRMASWVIVPFFVVFIFGGLQLFKKYTSYVRPVISITSAVFFYIAVVGALHVSRGPSLAFDEQGRIYFYTLITLYALSLILFWRTKKAAHIDVNYWQYIVIVLPVLITFAASLTYSDWLPTYVYNYSFSFIVAGSVVYLFFWEQASSYAKQFLWVCGVGFICAYFIFPKLTIGTKQFNPATEIQAQSAWQVIEFIQANTQVNDKIFTAVPFFALRSGRELALPLTHPVVYTSKQNDPKPYDPYEVIPSVSEIQEHLKNNRIKYIILDERTRSLFASSRHPEIAKFIKKNYEPIQEFGNIKILKRVD